MGELAIDPATDMELSPKGGFDWTRVAWSGLHETQPERCSYCGGALPGDDDPEIPLRLWSDSGWAAVFCLACMRTWWGFETSDLDEGVELEVDWPEEDND